jgi:hypothetical protein
MTPKRQNPYTPESSVWVGSEGEEGFCHLLVGGASGREAKAGDYPSGVDGDEQTKTLLPPSQAIAPADIGGASQPSMSPPALSVSGRHCRAI